MTEISILEVPQQFLAGESAGQGLEYKLGRACTAHCFAAAQEIMGVDKTTIAELIDFVASYGAETASELYSDGKGWNIAGLSDLLRLKGFPVVSQNMYYDAAESNMSNAKRYGRVRNEYEKTRLWLYAARGGQDRSRWVQAMSGTLEFGGSVITSIQIPLLSGDGYGLHAVVVTGIDEQEGQITYFDPDHYNTARYGKQAPHIDRLDDTALMYQRPINDHLGIMTGEVIHVFPPRLT